MPHFAFTIYDRRKGPSPFILTCEHASSRVPAPLRTSPKDRLFLKTHYGWDIGGANVTREVARQTSSTAVLCRFSRLVCDANRPMADPTWALKTLEGHDLSFNKGLSPDENQRRAQTLWRPYHQAIDDVLSERLEEDRRVLLIAIHTFTPSFPGQERSMEVAVLYHMHEEPGLWMARALEETGYKVAVNTPYSGKDGMMYSPWRHGNTHDVINLEIEIRQDLIDTPSKAKAVGKILSRNLKALHHHIFCDA